MTKDWQNYFKTIEIGGWAHGVMDIHSVTAFVWVENFREDNAHGQVMTPCCLSAGAHFHPHPGDPHIRVSGCGPDRQPTCIGVPLLCIIYTEWPYILLPFCPP